MLKPRILRHFMLLSAFTLVASTKTTIAVADQAPSHIRSLPAESTRTDRYEERFWDTLIAKAALQIKELWPSLHLRLASDKEKVINEFFEELNVKAAEGNLFASGVYQEWARRVLGAYEDSAKAYKALFRELKKHFSDYELATFVRGGRESQKTRAVANTFYNLQMEDWVSSMEARDVFRALKLDTGKVNVFKNPLLETYVSFTALSRRLKSANGQEIYDELYRMLKENFGVFRVSEMLGAMNVNRRKDFNVGMVMDALFRDASLIELSSVKDLLNNRAFVESSAVSIWLLYAKRWTTPEEYSNFVIYVVKTVWDQHGVKDKALATVITAAQEDKSTREFAERALIKLFDSWKNEKLTAKDILNILGLNLAKMTAEDIIESPLLMTWFAFESRSRANDADLLRALREQLSDEKLASMLVIKPRNLLMKIRLRSVQKTLFHFWQAESLDVDGVFQRLQLDKAGDKLFTHPALNVWYRYVVKYRGTNSYDIIPRVVKKYYPDSELLLDMVHRALTRKEHSGASSIAKLLEQNGISSSS